MKKLIISVITGAILIGIGICVTVFEVAQFDVSETLPYIKSSKNEVYTLKEDENIFKNNKEIYLNYYLGSYFSDYGKITVQEDKNIEGIQIDIIYSGKKANFYLDSYYHEHAAEVYDEDSFTELYIRRAGVSFTPKEALEIAQYIFKNKTFIEHAEPYYVKEVIVRTANPQLINFY